jgi:glutamate formiminotransferase
MHRDPPRNVVSSVCSDFGPRDVPQRCGVAVIGSQAYVTNFNIEIARASLETCKEVAAGLRVELGVQCMALYHGSDSVEIGCNLQATDVNDCPCPEVVLSSVSRLLPAEAIVTRSYVVGLAPHDALNIALRAMI